MNGEKREAARVQFRHEIKHYMNYADYIYLRGRLKAVMKPDEHVSEKGYYEIRSLYFDTCTDKALREKMDGIFEREKFRIRCYDMNYDFIRLEKKVKKGGLGYKLSAPLTAEETKLILLGDIGWMKERRDGLLLEMYEKMRLYGLRPKTVVDYTREPYTYPAGNVRVTLDYNIRTGLWETDFLGKEVPTVSACPNEYILEVKYDNFIPDIIRDIVQLRYRDENAFSKYEVCRRLG